jgi:hypothetical protein
MVGGWWSKGKNKRGMLLCENSFWKRSLMWPHFFLCVFSWCLSTWMLLAIERPTTPCW